MGKAFADITNTPWPTGLAACCDCASPPAWYPRRGNCASIGWHSRLKVRQQVWPHAVELIRCGALAWAEGLGCRTEEILKLCDPGAAGEPVEGARGTVRRLDRYWGGAPMATVEAKTALVMTWPKPTTGRMIAMLGKVEVEGRETEPHSFSFLPRGAVLRMAAGALVLLRRTPVGLLMEAALAADTRMWWPSV